MNSPKSNKPKTKHKAQTTCLPNVRAEKELEVHQEMQSEWIKKEHNSLQKYSKKKKLITKNQFNTSMTKSNVLGSCPFMGIYRNSEFLLHKFRLQGIRAAILSGIDFVNYF